MANHNKKHTKNLINICFSLSPCFICILLVNILCMNCIRYNFMILVVNNSNLLLHLLFVSYFYIYSICYLLSYCFFFVLSCILYFIDSFYWAFWILKFVLCVCHMLTNICFVVRYSLASQYYLFRSCDKYWNQCILKSILFLTIPPPKLNEQEEHKEKKNLSGNLKLVLFHHSPIDKNFHKMQMSNQIYSNQFKFINSLHCMYSLHEYGPIFRLQCEAWRA